jgi:hypothetical protein
MCSSVNRLWMKFFCLLLLAIKWKYFVFASPNRSQVNLDLCLPLLLSTVARPKIPSFRFFNKLHSPGITTWPLEPSPVDVPLLCRLPKLIFLEVLEFWPKILKLLLSYLAWCVE